MILSLAYQFVEIVCFGRNRWWDLTARRVYWTDMVERVMRVFFYIVA